MSGDSKCTVYIGNLDERVTDRVLYDILIQAGRVLDLHIPRDRETDKPKGFAFAEYETEEIANYAVKLFSGLVILYKRTLKFGISGQDKAPGNMASPSMLPSNSQHRSRFRPIPYNNVEDPHLFNRAPSSSRFQSNPGNFEPDLLPPGVGPDSSMYRSHHDDQDSNMYRSRRDDLNHDYSRRGFGPTLDGIGRSWSGRY